MSVRDFLLKHILPPIQGPDFPQEFNSHRVSEEFMKSCRKAGKLFNKNKPIKEESTNEK